jgi:hypothetical protein
VKRYRIVILSDPFPELLLLDDSAASCYAGEHALVIRTNHDPLGGWLDERVVPWHRIIDYRQETIA